MKPRFLVLFLAVTLSLPTLAQEKKTEAKTKTKETTTEKKTEAKNEKSKGKKPDTKGKKPAKVKTRVLKATKPSRDGKVEKDPLLLKVPVTWKDVKLSRMSMRTNTLTIPAVKPEKMPGELAIFRFNSQSLPDNIDRYVNKFQKTGRKKKITTGVVKASGLFPAIKDPKVTVPYYMIEVSGTYKKPDGPPMLRRTKDVPGSRMLAVIMPIKGKGMYFFTMTGSDKTIAAQRKILRDTFGGNEKTEKPYGRS